MDESDFEAACRQVERHGWKLLHSVNECVSVYGRVCRLAETVAALYVYVTFEGEICRATGPSLRGSYENSNYGRWGWPGVPCRAVQERRYGPA
jgi:hypothetical protein